jgi:hypothetical protein
VDLSGLDCSADPDVVVAVDMTTAEAEKVGSSCGGSETEWKALDKLYSSCFGDRVQGARQKVWESMDSAAAE